MTRPAIHPGEILAEELQEVGMSASELTGILRVPANRISQILAGKRGITADTALRLGQWLGTGAEIWLNLQKAYELRLAQAKSGDEIKRTMPTRATVQRCCPYQPTGNTRCLSRDLRRKRHKPTH